MPQIDAMTSAAGALATSVPLLVHARPERILAWRDGQPVRVAAFLADVAALAARLPAAPAAVNLCADRYAFLVAFAAVMARRQVNLLPPSRAVHAIDAALAAHPGSYALGDAELDPAPPHYVKFAPSCIPAPAPLPWVAADAVAAIGYTSGSTGVPKGNVKRWDKLAISSAHNDTRLRRLAGGDYHMVATVPPQHMYGLELSVLLPLFGRSTVSTERPFYPADVAAALARVPAPRILVTTPVHLRALVAAHPALPPLAGIFSSTAPLPRELAAMAEAYFGAPVCEGFGSTETCVIAQRRTARDDAWTLCPGVVLSPQPDGTRVDAPQLLQPVVLADIVEVLDGRRFRLRGRSTDLLEIAGKRASLGDLTHKLLGIPGVHDGVVFQLEAADSMGIQRIAALVVAPELGEGAILDALRREVDPVFLPRPLRKVASLPRNATGKLPRAALVALLRVDSTLG